MVGILRDDGPLISNHKEGEMKDAHGETFSNASQDYRLEGGKQNHDVFAFAGNAKICAEVHASTMTGGPEQEKRLAEALTLFAPDLSYRPTSSDYFTLATVFYQQSPMMGAPFYEGALKTIPTDTTDPDLITRRRIATDQIAIALGMNGNIKGSWSYAERGIKLDPTYPLNYYNLACADAEEGKVKDARVHLQQAFDRKANTIPGESLPDPTKNDSILKLKMDKYFWAFVQTLH